MRAGPALRSIKASALSRGSSRAIDSAQGCAIRAGL